MPTNSESSLGNRYNDKLLTAVEVAGLLGISRSFAYQLMRRGEIRMVKLGRAVRMRQDDLGDFVEDNLSSPYSSLGEVFAKKSEVGHRDH